MTHSIGPLDQPLNDYQLQHLGKELEPSKEYFEAKRGLWGHIVKRFGNTRIFSLIKEKVFNAPNLSKYSFTHEPPKGALLKFGAHIKYFNDAHKKLGEALGKDIKEKAAIEAEINQKTLNNTEKFEKEEKIKEIDENIEVLTNEINKLIKQYRDQFISIQSIFDNATKKFSYLDEVSQIKNEFVKFVNTHKNPEEINQTILQVPVPEEKTQEQQEKSPLTELDHLDELLNSLQINPNKEKVEEEKQLAIEHNEKEHKETKPKQDSLDDFLDQLTPEEHALGEELFPAKEKQNKLDKPKDHIDEILDDIEKDLKEKDIKKVRNSAADAIEKVNNKIPIEKSSDIVKFNLRRITDELRVRDGFLIGAGVKGIKAAVNVSIRSTEEYYSYNKIEIPEGLLDNLRKISEELKSL